MAVHAGNDCVLKLTDAGDTERDLSAYVTSLTFDLKGKTLVDVTAMSDSGKTWASDELEDCTFTVDFLYDSGSDTVWDTLCGATNGLRTASTAKAFEVGPEGDESNDPKLTGSCFLESVSTEVPIGDVIRMNGVTFRVSGTVTVGSYA